MFKKAFLFLCVLMITACQIPGSANNSDMNASPSIPDKRTEQPVSPPSVVMSSSTPTPQNSSAFCEEMYQKQYGDPQLKTYQPVTYETENDELPINLAQVENDR